LSPTAVNLPNGYGSTTTSARPSSRGSPN
jgi:hypothetical protein